MDIFWFIPGYQSAIYSTGREPAFIMLLSFVITYILTRGYTRMARKTGWRSAKLGGVHAHHMIFGLIIAFTSGAMLLSFGPLTGPFLLILSAMFGCGAALVLDEFALIFHLEDVYWEHEGRKSVDAVVLGIALGSLLLMRATPFGLNSGYPDWILAITVVINIVFALVAALKGKLYLTLFGIFVPTLAQIGAIRLAEPNSVWARKFYKNDRKKLRKSKKRYKTYEKIWITRKLRAWDMIGGKVNRPSRAT